MFKPLIFSLVLILVLTNLFAQSNSNDSVVRIAKSDVRHFRLSKTEMKQFRKEKKLFDANVFAPTTATASDTALLSNPDYVKAFSAAAYKQTKKRRTVWHYALIGGTAYVAIGVATVVALLVTFN